MEDIREALNLNQLLLPVIEPFPESVTNPQNPKALDELLEHLIKEAESLDPDSRKHLLSATALVKSMSKYEEKNVTALCYFRLGIIAGRMMTPFRNLDAVSEALRKGNISQIADMKRQHPIKKLNEIKALTQEIVKNLAQHIWKKESTEIRIGKMAEMVFHECTHNPEYAAIASTLPQNAKELKPWLREIAPPEAQKAGRPRKK